MSIQSAQAFLERMRTDPALVDRLAKAASPQDRRALALSLGFDFTAEELDAAKKELPDEELDRIGGGKDAPSCVPVAFFVSG
jgi:predicted ribosomally synthesized peptide with nif11-like leader